MYFDASRNPVTAIDLVETLLAPIQQQLSAPMANLPGPSGVQTETYNHLVRCYNALLQQSQRSLNSLELQLQAAKAENLRLQAQLIRLSTR